MPPTTHSTELGRSHEPGRLATMAAPTEEGPQESGWDAELSKALYDMISSGADWDERFDSKLEALEERYQDVVYAELIHLLAHLRIPPDEARQHWQQIAEHRASMQEQMGLSVDFRVALASYFVNVKHLLKNPKIIEMRLYEQTRACAYRDELTGLRNYRFFAEVLPQEIARSRQYNSPLSLAMLDVDDFKNFNDTYGHETANRALIAIGKLASASVRQVDVVARYGGEEFALILPSTPKDATAEVAERVRKSIGEHAFTVEGKEIRLTVSIGVATCPADARAADELIRNADAAMYQAKSDGKNRVRLHGNSMRSYRRARESFAGTLTLAGPECHPLTTVNLSPGGMLFVTATPVWKGGLVDIRLELPEGRRKILVSGRVVAVREQPDGEFEVATRTVEMSPADRWALAESLRDSDAPPR